MSFQTRTESLVYITNELNIQAKAYLGIVASPELVTSIRKKLVTYVGEKLSYIGVEVKLRLTLTKEKVIKNIQVVCEGKPMYDPMLSLLLRSAEDNQVKVKTIIDRDTINYEFDKKKSPYGSKPLPGVHGLVNDDPAYHKVYGGIGLMDKYAKAKKAIGVTPYPKVNQFLSYLASKNNKINEWVEYYSPQKVALRKLKKELQSHSDDWMVLAGLRERNNY